MLEVLALRPRVRTLGSEIVRTVGSEIVSEDCWL